MIKMNYTGESYNYGDIGSQAYTINTNIELEEDCTLTEALGAMIDLCKIAGYCISEQSLNNAIADYIEMHEFD